MYVTPPEKRRVRISSGTSHSTKLASLAACHPFSHQLDLVFPSNPTLLEALGKLETSYGKAKCKLSDIVAHSEAFLNGEGESNLLILSSNTPEEEDVWCIDPRGHLTLSVSKDTYERLGLVGPKLPFKGYHERHVIDITLQKTIESVAIRRRQRTSLELWDKRREKELGMDAGLWDVVYCWKGEPHDTPLQGTKLHRVQCKKNELRDVHVPIPALEPRPSPFPSKSGLKSEATEDNEDLSDDWNRRVGSLFEWIGMACLGAQRLHINDRVDPFVALYEPPLPSETQNVTHLQWRGLLEPSFIKQVIDTVLADLQDPTSTIPFVGITSHALTSSPVGYIPYNSTPTGALQAPANVPAKVPRLDGEDTWSLIAERHVVPANAQEASGAPSTRWYLAESVGQWDARWG